MRTSSLIVLMMLAGCGSGSAQFEEQGDCVPPAGSTMVNVDPSWQPQFQGSCLLPRGATRTQPFERFRTRAEFDARIDVASCPNLSAAMVDFATAEVLLIGGYNNEIGGVSIKFLADDGATRYLGLLGRAVGFPLPDFLVRAPASQKPMVLRSCRSVCVRNCDQAIP